MRKKVINKNVNLNYHAENVSDINRQKLSNSLKRRAVDNNYLDRTIENRTLRIEKKRRHINY